MLTLTLFALFHILSILDGTLTYIGIMRLGIDFELNPFIRWAMYHMGIASAIVTFKTVAAVFVTWLMSRLKVPAANVFLTFNVLVLFFICVLPWLFVLLVT